MTKAKEAYKKLWKETNGDYWHTRVNEFFIEFDNEIDKALTLLDKVERGGDENDNLYKGFMCVQTVNAVTDKYILIERE